MAHSPATQSPISNSCAPNPNTCLILGDSSTKYIKIDDDLLSSHRIPTYLIEDIDPNVCAGYKKIWVHVGTNNIKTIRCSNTNDIHRHFNNFIHKLDIIRSMCPHSKIIVSSIPPQPFRHSISVQSFLIDYLCRNSAFLPLWTSICFLALTGI